MVYRLGQQDAFWTSETGVTETCGQNDFELIAKDLPSHRMTSAWENRLRKVRAFFKNEARRKREEEEKIL